MSLGADEHIDYRTKAFEETVSNIDFVLDGMGGEILVRSLQVMKDGGTIISLPSPQFPDQVLEQAAGRKVNVSFLMVRSNGKDMNTLKQLLTNGTLHPHVSKTFSFAEMDKAHLEVGTGRVVGKIIVKI